MADPQIGSAGLRGPAAAKRQRVSISQQDLVRAEPLLPGQAIPVAIQPALPGLDLLAWAAENRSRIEELLLAHRALLFRGFDLRSVEDFDRFTHLTSSGELLEYRDRSSPRHEVGEKIYTSTDYPADQWIFLHNEGTYWLTWPLKIYFACLIAAERGGETPIADCRKVLARIDPAVRERFARRGVMYVRNFNDGFGLTWQTVFQTTEREVVEDYCRRNRIEVEWKPGDRLRTRQVRQAIATHPRTGEAVWFNHATFFHVSTLEPAVRERLLGEFAEEDLPYNTYYGDGAPIEPAVLDDLRAAYLAERIAFPWRPGDVLMLDNMTVAHGRAPYSGERKIVVGMADPWTPPRD